MINLSSMVVMICQFTMIVKINKSSTCVIINKSSMIVMINQPTMIIMIILSLMIIMFYQSELIRTIVKENGILVTSYSTLVIHQNLILDHNWHYIILDEGHKIRNPDAQATLVVKQVSNLLV